MAAILWDRRGEPQSHKGCERRRSHAPSPQRKRAVTPCVLILLWLSLQFLGRPRDAGSTCVKKQTLTQTTHGYCESISICFRSHRAALFRTSMRCLGLQSAFALPCPTFPSVRTSDSSQTPLNSPYSIHQPLTLRLFSLLTRCRAHRPPKPLSLPFMLFTCSHRRRGSGRCRGRDTRCSGWSGTRA